MQVIFTPVEVYKVNKYTYLHWSWILHYLHAQMLCDIDPSHQLHNYTYTRKGQWFTLTQPHCLDAYIHASYPWNIHQTNAHITMGISPGKICTTLALAPLKIKMKTFANIKIEIIWSQNNWHIILFSKLGLFLHYFDV